MTTRRLRSINPNDPNALQQIIEMLEVSEGIRGGNDERKPTLAEVKKLILTGGGIPQLFSGSTAAQSLGSNTVARKPTGLRHEVLLGCATVIWDIPDYIGHSKTEIWRSDTDDIQAAIFYGECGANYFLDSNVDVGRTYFYFLRHKTSERLGSVKSGFTASYGVPIPSEPIITAERPTGLIYELLSSGVGVSWDIPSYRGHSKTEVWRSDTDDIQAAIFLGECGASYFIDLSATDNHVYFYFIRHKTSERLGSVKSEFTTSLHVNIPQVVVPTQPIPVAGEITTTGDSIITVQNAGRPVVIEVQGFFRSELQWDEVNLTLLPEDGNLLSIDIRHGGVVLKTISPDKTQTSLLGSNGEAVFQQSVGSFLVHQSNEDTTDYTISVSKQFPSNLDSFSLSYKITP